MVDLLNTHRCRAHYAGAVLLILAILAGGCVPTPTSSLRAAGDVRFSELSPTRATTARATQPVAAAPSLIPFVSIVPEHDGTSVLIYASGTSALSEGTLWANVDIGPGGNKGSYTMTFSNTKRSYIATAPNFTPGQSQDGTLSLTTTMGLASSLISFHREHVPVSAQPIIPSEDGLFRLELINAGTFITDTYIVIVSSFAPPGLPPLGHRIIGSVYSARAPEEVIETTKPMLVSMRYDEAGLAGADPHSLAIFAWNASSGSWVRQEGQLFTSDHSLSIAMRRFTTFALMVTPAWRDGFDDTSGLNLDQSTNIKRSLGAVKLATTPGSGTAISRPIIPPAGFGGWGTLTYTSTAPPATSLTIDVLDLNGQPLLTNVPSGASLDALDPTHYPGLILRANMASAELNTTPLLSMWQLTWQGRQDVYLPLIMS